MILGWLDWTSATFPTQSLVVIVSTTSANSSDIPCCKDSSLLACKISTINPNVLGQAKLMMPNGILLRFVSKEDFDDHSTYHYSNVQGDDATINFNAASGAMFAHVATNGGESFVLESCGSAGHVWKQIDVRLLGDDEGVSLGNGTSSSDDSKKDFDGGVVKASTGGKNAGDNSTIVTYSIKFYYTPEFQAATPDIEGFIDAVVDETNLGYNNSQVPLKATKLCTELATINDSTPNILNAFANMKSSATELRDTADAAALLVLGFSYCGQGYLNTIPSGYTVSVTRKSCALGYYSFGHEVGHNIGLHHNVEASTNTAYPYGHGHLIDAGTASTGVRTILAYNANGHSTRVNYYSNPSVNYPGTGTPTGELKVKGYVLRKVMLILIVHMKNRPSRSKTTFYA